MKVLRQFQSYKRISHQAGTGIRTSIQLPSRRNQAVHLSCPVNVLSPQSYSIDVPSLQGTEEAHYASGWQEFLEMTGLVPSW